MLQARCLGCDEIFVPEDENDLEHGVREDGEACGELGIIEGEWVLTNG